MSVHVNNIATTATPPLRCFFIYQDGSQCVRIARYPEQGACFLHRDAAKDKVCAGYRLDGKPCTTKMTSPKRDLCRQCELIKTLSKKGVIKKGAIKAPKVEKPVQTVAATFNPQMGPFLMAIATAKPSTGDAAVTLYWFKDKGRYVFSVDQIVADFRLSPYTSCWLQWNSKWRGARFAGVSLGVNLHNIAGTNQYVIDAEYAKGIFTERKTTAAHRASYIEICRQIDALLALIPKKDITPIPVADAPAPLKATPPPIAAIIVDPVSVVPLDPNKIASDWAAAVKPSEATQVAQAVAQASEPTRLPFELSLNKEERKLVEDVKALALDAVHRLEQVRDDVAGLTKALRETAIGAHLDIGPVHSGITGIKAELNNLTATVKGGVSTIGSNLTTIGNQLKAIQLDSKMASTDTAKMVKLLEAMLSIWRGSEEDGPTN